MTSIAFGERDPSLTVSLDAASSSTFVGVTKLSMATRSYNRRPRLSSCTVEAEIYDDNDQLSFGIRMMIIVGCGLLGWAVPIAMAWSFF